MRKRLFGAAVAAILTVFMSACGGGQGRISGEVHEADIVVYGGTSGAVAAAVQAARDNGVENRVDFQVLAGDLRSIETLLPPGGFDGCVANPPYFPVGSGASGARANARSEVTLTLKELCRAAQWLLTYGGRFALVHRPERLADLMEALRAHQLEPKRLRLLRHRAEKPPSLLLLEAKKGAKPGLVWEPDLILRDEDGRESAACRALYHRDGKDCD